MTKNLNVDAQFMINAKKAVISWKKIMQIYAIY